MLIKCKNVMLFVCNIICTVGSQKFHTLSYCGRVTSKLSKELCQASDELTNNFNSKGYRDVRNEQQLGL